MKKRIIQIIGIMAILVAIFYFVFYRPINKYIDTHTWATISTVESIEDETSDVFVESAEYLKGDRMRVYSAVLLIEDITHDGTVTFSVSEGALYDENDIQVTEFKIEREKSRNFFQEYGSVEISVGSVRYQ